MEIKFAVKEFSEEMTKLLYVELIKKMEINDLIPLFVQVGSTTTILNNIDSMLGNVESIEYDSKTKRIYVTIDVLSIWDRYFENYKSIVDDFVLSPFIIIDNKTGDIINVRRLELVPKIKNMEE